MIMLQINRCWIIIGRTYFVLRVHSICRPNNYRHISIWVWL